MGDNISREGESARLDEFCGRSLMGFQAEELGLLEEVRKQLALGRAE